MGNENVVCDRCKEELHDGEGYLAYSDAFIEGREVGCLLMCETCAKKLYTKENISKARWYVDFTQEDYLRMGLNNPNDVQLLTVASIRGYTPEQALDKARRFAITWWLDPMTAAKEAEMHVDGSRWIKRQVRAQKRKWWQFWD